MNPIITSLEDLPDYVGRVSHVISIIDPESLESLPAMRVPFGQHLVLCCHDVSSRAEARERERQMPGSRCIPPTTTMVARALRFAARLSESDSLVINCNLGLSRSPAIALAILAQAEPTVSERELFLRVLNLRPEASPSPLIVGFADKRLRRGGRLSQAILGPTS